MKTTTKFAIGSVAVVALSAGVAGVTAYAMMEKNQDNTSFYESFETASPLRTAAFDASSMQPVDLTKAAESTLNSVVHIMSIQRSKIQTIQGQPDILTSSSVTVEDASSKYRLRNREVSVRVSSSQRMVTS